MALNRIFSSTQLVCHSKAEGVYAQYQEHSESSELCAELESRVRSENLLSEEAERDYVSNACQQHRTHESFIKNQVM